MPQPLRLRMRLPSSAPKTSLCDALDKLLDTGVVVAGELTVKVADVELLYVAVELVAGSWESMQRLKEPSGDLVIEPAGEVTATAGSLFARSPDGPITRCH